jgi:hypothetical protein
MRKYWFILFLCAFIAVGALTHAGSRSTSEQPLGNDNILWFDSLNMSFVGNYPFSYCYGVEYDSVRNIAFLGSGGGVYVIDVSDPANPLKLSESLHTRGLVYGIAYN